MVRRPSDGLLMLRIAGYQGRLYSTSRWAVAALWPEDLPAGVPAEDRNRPDVHG